MSLGTDTYKSRVYRWDVNTLSWVVWDGTLQPDGPITIGTVNQGTGGSSAWKVDGSGVVQPVSATDLDIRNLLFALDKVDASGSQVATKTPLTPSAPAVASVGIASAQVVAANAARKGLKFVNVSSARISLGHGAAAVLDSGDTIYPGGTFAMNEYDFHVGAVFAIAASPASNLAIQELTS